MNKSTGIFIGICVLLLIVISTLNKSNKHREINKKYEGIVIRKYFYNNKNSEVTPRIVFLCDTLQIEMDVLTDNNVFNNISNGDTISVELNSKNIILDK